MAHGMLHDITVAMTTLKISLEVFPCKGRHFPEGITSCEVSRTRVGAEEVSLRTNLTQLTTTIGHETPARKCLPNLNEGLLSIFENFY